MVRTILAAAIIVGVVVGTPAAASASTADAGISASVVSTADTPDFTPSPSKWREYMLNVTGRMLGRAMPGSWKAEQIANQYRYNQSWEKFRVDYGYDAANPNFKTNPQTYEDYVLRDLETRKANGGTKGKRFKAPATKMGKFGKVVTGAAGSTLLTAAPEVGTFLGGSLVNGVGGVGDWLGWWSYDGEGAVCSNVGSDTVGQLVSWASGQDCDAWALNEDYQANIDAATGNWSGSGFGLTVLRYQGLGTDGSRYYRAIYQPQKTWPAIYAKKADGGWVEASAACGVSTCWGASGGSATPANFPRAGFALCVGVVSVAGCNAPGAPILQPVEEMGDPDRYLDCVVKYSDGSSLTASGATYKESSGSIQPPTCPDTPPGKVPAEVSVLENGNGPAKELYKEPTTDAFQQFVKDYAECNYGNCKLDLILKGTQASCFDLEAGCAGWWEDGSKADKYQCRYGTHDVDMSECAIYAGLFTPGRVEVGAPYSDPMTGDWSGGANAPTPDRQAMGQKIQDPAATHRSCDGMAVTGFDPIGFVMRPIQCALEWAFVPRPLVVQADMVGAGKAWDGKPPAQIAGLVGSLSLTPATKGCSKDVTLFGVTFPIIDNCPGSAMSTITGISRVVTAVAMLFLVIMVLRRQIAGMVGYNRGQ